MGQIGDFVQKIAPKSCFLRTQIWFFRLWRGLGPQNFKLSSFSTLPLKNLGNIGQNELWAGAVA